MADRQGIEIDYCPECRGVWLDRGELDKLLDRSASHRERERESQSSYQRDGVRGQKSRRWLGEIFDFD